ncbi:substrate-binding domain-containing protein [Nocardioides acrostichi]|uniref:Substrate-binding domain-containing protein n=1 Tax=Nocardioides acrostichi TaxID=2784339 RepID=A0A930UXA4_9ACTN|nr:substrate-binding domain-containing protein [Nocardioides acrostichi]MBF4160765.1 substrate-binding domain-containing protein [Nocardioides acrostichi]
MTVEEAKSIVAKATQPSTKWTGPTTGPRAKEGGETIAYVSSDQSYVSYVNWGDGVKDAADKLGWEYKAFDGKGTVSGTLTAMQQAVASNPVAIVTSADASALQAPISQAVKNGIPVIGIHATAYPGPDPELGLFTNIASDPAEIGRTQAAYVIATSDGTAKLAHMLDNSYAIARFKAEAATTPVENLSTATFLESINIPVAEQSKRIPTAVSALLSKYGSDNVWITTCCDNFYPYVAAALRSSGVAPNAIKLVGADGAPSAYDMIRKGQYEVATVPEPSTLFGYQAVDAVVHAMAGEAPDEFVAPTYLVVKDNVDAEGGSKDQYIPSNGFACHYANIWLGTNDDCSAAS